MLALHACITCLHYLPKLCHLNGGLGLSEGQYLVAKACLSDVFVWYKHAQHPLGTVAGGKLNAHTCD